MRIKVFFLTLCAFFVPLAAVEAAGALVYCGFSGAQNAFVASSCQLCNLAQTIQLVLNFLLGLSIPICVGMFAWAGILYFTARGNTGQIERAHKIFSSVLIGFIITTSGWFIVQVAVNTLTNQSFSWKTIQCVNDRSEQNTARPRSGQVSGIFNPLLALPGGGGVAPGGGTGAATPGATDTQAGALNAISVACGGTATDSGVPGCITISSTNNCTSQAAGCTSLQGISQSTLDQVIQLQSRCGCSVVITGGTEAGHDGGTSHTSGLAIDVSITQSASNLSATVLNTPGLSGPVQTSNGPQYTTPDGTIFLNEGNHWHIQTAH